MSILCLSCTSKWELFWIELPAFMMFREDIEYLGMDTWCWGFDHHRSLRAQVKCGYIRFLNWSCWISEAVPSCLCCNKNIDMAMPSPNARVLGCECEVHAHVLFREWLTLRNDYHFAADHVDLKILFACRDTHTSVNFSLPLLRSMHSVCIRLWNVIRWNDLNYFLMSCMITLHK